MTAERINSTQDRDEAERRRRDGEHAESEQKTSFQDIFAALLMLFFNFQQETDGADTSPDTNSSLTLLAGILGLDFEQLRQIRQRVRDGEESAVGAAFSTALSVDRSRVDTQRLNNYSSSHSNPASASHIQSLSQSASSVYGSYSDDAWEGFLQHLTTREGYRNKVYLDSRGFPTVGVGHLVKPEDNLKVGDTIPDERVMAFLETDARASWEAAQRQAIEMGINDKQVIIGLASVNYQLGNAWNDTKFKNTWEKLCCGQFETVIEDSYDWAWQEQTPVRVDDFRAVLQRAANIKAGHIEAEPLATSEATTQTAQTRTTGLTAIHDAAIAAGGTNETTPPATTGEKFTAAASGAQIQDFGVLATDTNHVPEETTVAVGTITLKLPGAKV